MSRKFIKVFALVFFTSYLLLVPLTVMKGGNFYAPNPSLAAADHLKAITLLPLKDVPAISRKAQKQKPVRTAFRVPQLHPKLQVGINMAKSSTTRETATSDINLKHEGFRGPCGPPAFVDDKLTLCLVCVYSVMSVIFLFCGYRCFRFCLFVTAFTAASAVTYGICAQEQFMSYNLSIPLAVTAGVLFGLLSMVIQFVGAFVIGLHSGFIGTIVCLAFFNYYFDQEHRACWLHMLLVIVCGITAGVLNIIKRKATTIISTSICGATLLTICTSYYFSKLASLKWVVQRFKSNSGELCPMSWGLISIWLISTIAGIIVQFNLTGRGIHHEQRNVTQKRRPIPQPLRLTREERAEARQRKYRYLYQVRTAHGDVISQNYIKAIQKTSEHWNSGLECSTLQSDSTHLTVLAPDQVAIPNSAEDMNHIRLCH